MSHPVRWLNALAGAVVALAGGSPIASARPPAAIAAPSARPAVAAPRPIATLAQAPQPSPSPVPGFQVQDSRIEVLDTGVEPRQPLRLQFQPGDRQQATMTMGVELAAQQGNRTMPLPALPDIVIDLETEVRDPGTPGELVYEIRYGDATAAPGGDPAMQEAIAMSLQLLRGLSVVATVDDRGRVRSLELQGSDASAPNATNLESMNSLLQSADQLSFPLPEEAVGVGARWQVVSQLSLGGLEMMQTATYELVDREGDRLQLNLTLDQTAASPDDSESPALLQSLRSTGTGRIDLRLDRPLPERAAIEMESRVEMALPGETESLTSTSRLNLTLTPAAADDGSASPAAPTP